jgi:glycosyltransferase involved in cell wall biosynthesis
MKHPLLTPVILVMNDAYWLPFCLEASRGFFNRYVIYDVGSSDRTNEVITWFVDSMKDEKVEIFFRTTSPMHPRVQGIFRNSMIAEARSEWYMILDADEIYTPKSFTNIIEQTDDMDSSFKWYEPLYGVVPRIEIAGDLKSAYGRDKRVPHHRIYHRTAIWTGSHPGEVPLYKQTTKNERWFNDVTCYHFHNAERSPNDEEVPKRMERRARGTYRPGEAEPFDLLKSLPILKKSIAGFEPCPALAALRESDGQT